MQTETMQIAGMEWVVAEPGVDVDAGADVRQTWEAWLAARDAWLAGKRPKTRRAYGYAWWDFFQRFLMGLARPEGRRHDWQLWAAAPEGAQGPWQVGGRDVIGWQGEMREAGLSGSTINQRLSALSSYFTFCGSKFTLMVSGAEVPLAAHNPALKPEREEVEPYFKAQPLDEEQAARLLLAIPRDTVQGLRAFALVQAYLVLARRASELAELRWGDVFERRGKRWYAWENKGRAQVNQMPDFVWEAILEYLAAAGRLPSTGSGQMAPEDFIFTALQDSATRLPSVREKLAEADLSPGQYEPTARGLHPSTIRGLVKRYCRKAGVPVVRTHDLRHTAAELRGNADTRELAHLLGHTNLNTTEIYRRHLDLQPDETAEMARARLRAKMREVNDRGGDRDRDGCGDAGEVD